MYRATGKKKKKKKKKKKTASLSIICFCVFLSLAFSVNNYYSFPTFFPNSYADSGNRHTPLAESLRSSILTTIPCLTNAPAYPYEHLYALTFAIRIHHVCYVVTEISWMFFSKILSTHCTCG